MIASGIAYLMGVPVGWFSALTSGPLFILVAFGLLVEEVVETICRRQTWQKAVIDFALKTAGVFCGLLTWSGWWM